MTRPTSSVRWRILAILFTVSFVSYIVRLNLSIAGLSIQKDLGLTPTELGIVMSAFVYSYAIFQFPGGVFGQYFGARSTLTWMLLGWGAVTLASGLLPGLLGSSAAAVIITLFMLRLLMGAVQAPLFPVMAASIVSWFPAGRWALPNSICSVGAVLGATITPPLIAWLTEAYGWRLAFAVTAPLSILVAVVWRHYSRDDPAVHPGVSESELALIRTNSPPPPEKRLPPGLLRKLIADKQVLRITIAYFGMNYVWYIYFSWLFIYLVEERGFGMLESGFVASLPWLAGAVAVGIGGETCDRLCRKLGPRLGCRIPAMIGLVGAAVTLYVGALAPDPWVAVGLLTLCYASNQFTEGAFWQGASFLGGSYTSATAGILNTGGNLAGIVATVLTPVLFSQFGWLVALATGSLLAFAGALLWLTIRVDEAPDLPTPAETTAP